MIRKSDLRVGNYVQHGDVTYVVTDIQNDLAMVVQLGSEQIGGSYLLNDIDGIPITPKILTSHKWALKDKNNFVFKGQNPSGISYIDGLLDIECPYAGGPGVRVWINQDKAKEGHPGSATYITYFHQLQNLIFGLTTKELSELIL